MKYQVHGENVDTGIRVSMVMDGDSPGAVIERAAVLGVRVRAIQEVGSQRQTTATHAPSGSTTSTQVRQAASSPAPTLRATAAPEFASDGQAAEWVPDKPSLIAVWVVVGLVAVVVITIAVGNWDNSSSATRRSTVNVVPSPAAPVSIESFQLTPNTPPSSEGAVPVNQTPSDPSVEWEEVRRQIRGLESECAYLRQDLEANKVGVSESIKAWAKSKADYDAADEELKNTTDEAYRQMPLLKRRLAQNSMADWQADYKKYQELVTAGQRSLDEKNARLNDLRRQVAGH